MFGINVLTSTDRRYRINIDRTMDLEAFSEVFRIHDTPKIIEGRDEITSFDKRLAWVPGVNLQDIWKDGRAVAEENMKSGFKNAIASTVELYENEPVLDMLISIILCMKEKMKYSRTRSR